MFPTTWSSAKKTNSHKYLTGKPCKNGHVTYRYTASGACYACVRKVPNFSGKQRVCFTVDTRDVLRVKQFVDSLNMIRTL